MKDVKVPVTEDDKFLEKRRQERAARLEKAKERIRLQEQDKKDEAETQRKMKALKATPKKTAASEYDRRERAYQWYTRCGMITKEKLKIRIKTIPHCDITNEDIDLLPWMTGDRIVNVAKMMQYAREK